MVKSEAFSKRKGHGPTWRQTRPVTAFADKRTKVIPGFPRDLKGSESSFAKGALPKGASCSRKSQSVTVVMMLLDVAACMLKMSLSVLDQVIHFRSGRDPGRNVLIRVFLPPKSMKDASLLVVLTEEGMKRGWKVPLSKLFCVADVFPIHCLHIYAMLGIQQRTPESWSCQGLQPHVVGIRKRTLACLGSGGQGCHPARFYRWLREGPHA